jgi:carboxypeptidase Q
MSRMVFFVVWALLSGVVSAEEKADLLMINRIKSEAFENSKVMEHAWFLTDVYGPRMTNTPAFTAAAEWAVKTLTGYGLSSVGLEKWGPYGRGWSFSRFSAHQIEPQYAPLIGFPLAWSAGTNGPVTGEPIFTLIQSEGDFARWRGKLKGRLVLTDAIRDLSPITTPPAKRYTDAELLERAAAPEPGTPAPNPAFAALRRLREKTRQFLVDEGALVAIQSGRGEGGTIFGQASSTREKKDPIGVPTVVLTPEHYNRIARLIQKKVPVRLELDIRTTIHEDSSDSVNVIAEIPGGRKKDEVVMLGGHLDSWHAGTGATDNAAGCAVAIEAVRILKALNVKMDRTVRLALWSGEENGLLGSKAYVKAHFADIETMKLLPEHGKLSAYFNLDNGTGKIRGIYLQGNDMIRPVFDSWMSPLRDLGATTVSIRNTGSTDHKSFDDVGLPGFEFMQDQIEYLTRTHHSNMDVYDRLQKADLMQAAAVMAAFVYHTAMREEMLPRKPLPKAKPPKKDEPVEEKNDEDRPRVLTSARI